MNKSATKGEKLFFSCLLVLGLVVGIIFFASTSIYAGTTSETISGRLYEFEKGNHYDFEQMSDSKPTTINFGTLKITGDIKQLSDKGGIPAFEVQSGNVSVNFSLNTVYTGEDKSKWYLIDDNTKTVNGTVIESNIEKGAVIVQTSLDGIKWVTDKSFSNVTESEAYVSDIYTSKEIQQVNGCFYRIVVVYALEKVTGSSTYLFVTVDEKENVECAEVYQFYLINSSENSSNSTQASATPRKELGEVVNTGKDTGFANNNAIGSGDPHYGWTLGTFFVNGYTRETKDNITGTPIFLKNVGDRVTLWFNLKQDITQLNGKRNLKIYEDYNGYDQYFQTEKTNMRHGTLIIRYTDFEGVKHDPVIYTDYLAANATTGANTKVELFEEGDYEVSLDYEIVDTDWLDSYTNYKIFFTFSIRNGNCMVYPFDISSGAELQDNTITENGFKLDMAKSRYLTIDVTRTVLISGTNGRTEDVRFNRPAKDGDQYKDEGIYTFNVHNLYTGENTTKKIYVGNDPFLKALAYTQLSIKEIEEKLAIGYSIGVDGNLIEPKAEGEEESEPIIEQNEVTETYEETKTSTAEDDLLTTSIETNGSVEITDINEQNKSNGSIIAVIVAVLIVLVIGIAFFVLRAKKKKKEVEKSMINVEVPNEEQSEEGGSEE